MKCERSRLKVCIFVSSSEIKFGFVRHCNGYVIVVTFLTRKVSQVSLTDFNDSLICCRALKNKTHVIFFIGGKTDLGGEIDP